MHAEHICNVVNLTVLAALMLSRVRVSFAHEYDNLDKNEAMRLMLAQEKR